MGGVRVGERTEAQIVGHGQAAEEPSAFRHEGQAKLDPVGASTSAIVPPVKRMSPLRAGPRPALVFNRVVFPAPLAPTRATISPRPHLQRDALEREHAGAVCHVHVAHVEERLLPVSVGHGGARRDRL